uniref:PAP-associated domain-containing protein n=1 Tax=Cyclophora tenuis TaxID=216820 RepID=A0A7S1D1L3_CYCTE
MHQHVAAQAGSVAPNGQPVSDQRFYSNQNIHNMGTQAHFAPHSLPPWRGADVMNGLFSVDITFQGPEHGGLGSTRFSDDVVEESCRETGQPREQTPFVQVLMVLKEFLAQRRLNEPFTGGLSSYALLLLVVAVAKERKIIKQEMERVERQRMVVASGGNTVMTTRENGTSISAADKTVHTKPKACARTLEPKSDEQPMTSSVASPQAQTSRKKTAAPLSTPKGDAATKSRTNPQRAVKRQTEHSKPVPSHPKPRPKVSSWASIASKSPKPISQSNSVAASPVTVKSTPKAQSQPHKISSFAEAVSGKQQPTRPHPVKSSADQKEDTPKSESKKSRKHFGQSKSQGSSQTATSAKSPTIAIASRPERSKEQPNHNHNSGSKVPTGNQMKTADNTATEKESSDGQSETNLNAPSLFPQGSNDVLEVLCSGESTPGKLLMHFLLYYGQHFDSRATAVDVSGKNNPEYHRRNGMSPFPVLSPYVPRLTGGTMDPVTGMLTVDPIVIFDAIPGREGSNVARSCYAWSNIRWHFNHCYMTLSSAVERGGTPSSAAAVVEKGASNADGKRVDRSDTPNLVSPILELLLSF